jgi:type IV secretion system protein VirB9
MKQTRRVLFGAIASALLAGCATQPPAPAPYVPAAVVNRPPKHIDVPPDPMAALPTDIRNAILGGQLHTMREGITTTFPYSPHAQQLINCQVLRVTEIVLNGDETIARDGVGAGDTERWAIQPLNNRILVKPKEVGIATDLIVETNRRSYHFALRTRAPYMPQVAFYYPDDVKLADVARQSALREAARQAADPPQTKPLNFAYRIDGPNVAWKPLLAFDDGEHTYLQFPDNTMSSDMPTLMIQNGNQQALVNYQVRGSYYVADRLFQKAALTAGTGTNRQVVQIIAEGAR